jgi:feruloyl esterase
LSLSLGHNSTPLDGSWAYNAPEKVTNWGYRALHGSIVLGKELTRSYYRKDLAYSYYSGRSTGGRQGLKEAEMFPDDFNGIVAGAPAWWTTHLQLWNMKVGLYNLPTTAPYHIPSSLFPTIGDAVLKQCDPQDGLMDNIISDPTRCDFRPEAQWDMLVGADEPSSLGTDYVKYMLGLGPDWRWQDFNPSIIALSDRINPGNATANDFDLSPFYKKGGKLLHYHGFSDGSIATGNSVYFYNHVLRTLKPK